MISLFPKSRSTLYWGLGLTLGVSILCAVMKNYAAIIAVVIIGGWLSYFCSMYTAVGVYQGMVSILYGRLKPDDFIQVFAPVLKKVKPGSELEAAYRAHMGIAYCTKGAFDEALPWFTSENHSDNVRLMQMENRCLCYLQKGDAQAYLQERAQWEELANKAAGKEKARCDHALKLADIQYRVLQGKADTDMQVFVQKETQETNKRWHKMNMKLLLTRIYMIMNLQRAAEVELEDLVKLDPGLWITVKAREYQSQLS